MCERLMFGVVSFFCSLNEAIKSKGSKKNEKLRMKKKRMRGRK